MPAHCDRGSLVCRLWIEDEGQCLHRDHPSGCVRVVGDWSCVRRAQVRPPEFILMSLLLSRIVLNSDLLTDTCRAS